MKESPYIIEVTRIEIQQDELKPIPSERLTFEVLSPKRAIASLSVRQGPDKSKVTAVVEFRGDALILSRTEGDCDVQRVATVLRIHYLERYEKDGLRILGNRKDGKICDCTLEDPDHFHKFLHLLHTIGGLEYHVPERQESGVTPRGAPSKEGHEIRAELADRVYTPLLKEISLWKEPRRGGFSEWVRLEQEQRLWVKKVPQPIVDLLNETRTLFDTKGKLWIHVRSLIEDALNSTAPTIFGAENVQGLSNFEFRLLTKPGGTETLSIIWIWESEKDLSNYVMDFIESNYPPGTGYQMETWAVSRPSGTVKPVGRTNETRELINKVLSYLMIKQPAREIIQTNHKIRDNSDKLLSLIDAELGKD